MRQIKNPAMDQLRLQYEWLFCGNYVGMVFIHFNVLLRNRIDTHTKNELVTRLRGK